MTVAGRGAPLADRLAIRTWLLALLVNARAATMTIDESPEPDPADPRTPRRC
ncbi:hypothetical protein [Micromonospora sp. NPDC005203]|uniref:hypothetical protein n=1 Tax=Micromonospora sp. NPDC005203 TaxID=3364226 RepID=UPI0036804653